MTFDHWKTTNPADEFLGPSSDELAGEVLDAASWYTEGFAEASNGERSNSDKAGKFAASYRAGFNDAFKFGEA